MSPGTCFLNSPDSTVFRTGENKNGRNHPTSRLLMVTENNKDATAILIYKQQKCNKYLKKNRFPELHLYFFYVTFLCNIYFHNWLLLFFGYQYHWHPNPAPYGCLLLQLYQGATDQRHAAIQSKDVQSPERKLPEIGLIPSDHRYITLDVGTLLTSVGGGGERRSRKGEFFKAMKFQVSFFRVFFWFGGFFGAEMWRWERSGSYLHSCWKNSDEEFSVTN